MARQADIERALHDYLDSVEDTTVDAAADLVGILDGLLRRTLGPSGQAADMRKVLSALRGLTRGQTLDALSRRLAGQLVAFVDKVGREAALTTAREVMPAGLQRRLAILSDAVRQENQALLGPVFARRQAGSLARLFGVELQAMGARLSDAFEQAAVGGMTEASARALFGRLQADLATGGSIFGPVVDARRWQNTLAPVVGTFSDEQLAGAAWRAANPGASPDELAEGIGSMEYRWIAALVNTCTTCLARHGQTDIRDNWVARGMPPLHQRCACRLIPANLPGFDDVGYQDSVANLRELARTATAPDGSRLDEGITYRVPADLLERERAGRDVRINAETGEVRDVRLDRILRAATGETAEAAAVRRTLRLLGQANRGGGA